MAARRAWLIPLDLLLLGAAAVGVLQAAAKDDTSTVEGALFWISLVALPVLLAGLVVLVVGALVALVRRNPAGTPASRPRP